MPRQSEYQSRSGTLKRKRRSSDHCSNIENEPLQEEKRFKEERLLHQEEEIDNAVNDERLPLSELPVLRLSVGVDFNDLGRDDLSSPESMRDSSVLSPFTEDLTEEKSHTREDAVNDKFARGSPESIFESLEPSPCKYDTRASKKKNIRKCDTSSKTDNSALDKSCKVLLHWPTILCKVNWLKSKRWRCYYTSVDNGVSELRKINLLNNHPGLQPRMRAVLLEWLIEVCDVFKIHRETYYLAVDYIDRYLYHSYNVPKVKLQLIGISCLLIACKVEEIYPPKVAEFAFVTDGACSEDDILTMEINVIKVLDWKFKCITINCWLLIYLQLGYFSVRKEKTLDYLYPLYPPDLYSTAAQLLDLATLDMMSLRFKYSVLAISALNIVCSEKFPLKVSGYELNEIKDCVQWMESFWSAICDKKKSDNLNSLQSCGISPPKRLVTDLSHFLLQHVVNLELLECGQANFERLMHPSPSSLNLLTPPSSSKKIVHTEVLSD